MSLKNRASCSDHTSSGEANQKRLWIGNLDQRITEYRLMKHLQSFGKLEKFDMLFHRNGPQAGQPRGYAFVTFENYVDAEKCLRKLNNTKLGTQVIVVKYAHSMSKEEMEKSKVNLNLPVLVGVKKDKVGNRSANQSRLSKIQEIEAKLKKMEHSKEDIAESLLKKNLVSSQSNVKKIKL